MNQPEERASLVRSVALLKRNALAAPFERAFAIQRSLEANPPNPDGPPRDPNEDLMPVNYRPEEAIYVIPNVDRVTVVFSTVFREDTDMVYGKVFLQVRHFHPMSLRKGNPKVMSLVQEPLRLDLAHCSLIRNLLMLEDDQRFKQHLKFCIPTESRLERSVISQVLRPQKTWATSPLVTPSFPIMFPLSATHLTHASQSCFLVILLRLMLLSVPSHAFNCFVIIYTITSRLRRLISIRGCEQGPMNFSRF